MPLLPLPRQILTWQRWMSLAAHASKAVTQQHHGELAALFRALLPSDAIVFDVGAHAGQFAKLFARLVPQGTVYAFEPGRYPRMILMLALALNRVANVRMFPIGFSDRASRQELRTPIKRSGSLGFGLAHLGGDADGAAVEIVELATLDAFCGCFGIERIDFIKADIEGWELRLLHGGAETLRRLHPILWLEVNAGHLARPGDSVAALWAFLTALDYTAWRRESDGRLARLATPEEGDILWVASSTPAYRVVMAL